MTLKQMMTAGICAAMLLGVNMGVQAVADEEEVQYAVCDRKQEAAEMFEAEPYNPDSVPAEEFSGTVTEESPEARFEYTAPTSGVYLFEVKGLTDNCRVRFELYDYLGNRILEKAGTVEITEGKAYTLVVSQAEGNTEFTIVVNPSKPVLDISNLSMVDDSIDFEGGVNHYQFTAPRDGYYDFYIDHTTANAEFDISLYDKDHNKLGMEIEKKEGQTYDIYVKADYDSTVKVGQYSLHILHQKPTVDMTGYTWIEDEITFRGQRIYYAFTAPDSGTYEIKWELMGDERYTQCGILDEYGREIYDSGFGSWNRMIETTTVLLDKGDYICIYADGIYNPVIKYHVSIRYPVEAQGFLDSFVPGETISSSGTEASTSTTDEQSASSAEVAQLQSEIEQLESEKEELLAQVDELQSKYDALVDVVKAFGIDYQADATDE